MSPQFVESESMGIRWRLDPSQYIDAEILSTGSFEGHTTRFVAEFVKPGMTILDVGANFGYYAMLCARLAGATGRDVAFEPVAEFRERLLQHAQSNGFSNIEIFPYGLGERSGSARILVGTDSATSFWHDNNLEPRATEIMEIRALDDLATDGFLRRLDFLKIDIDGGEPAFFRGARNTIGRFKPVMVVEFAQMSLMAAGSSVEEVKDQITSQGYRLHREEDGSQIKGLADFQRYAHNCSHSVNVFCVPN